MRDRCFVSLRFVIPLIRETTTNGTATSRSNRIKIVPQGLIHSVSRCSHPPVTAQKPSPVPTSIPIRIVM